MAQLLFDAISATHRLKAVGRRNRIEQQLRHFRTPCEFLGPAGRADPSNHLYSAGASAESNAERVAVFSFQASFL